MCGFRRYSQFTYGFRCTCNANNWYHLRLSNEESFAAEQGSHQSISTLLPNKDGEDYSSSTNKKGEDIVSWKAEEPKGWGVWLLKLLLVNHWMIDSDTTISRVPEAWVGTSWSSSSCLSFFFCSSFHWFVTYLMRLCCSFFSVVSFAISRFVFLKTMQASWCSHIFIIHMKSWWKWIVKLLEMESHCQNFVLEMMIVNHWSRIFGLNLNNFLRDWKCD